MLQLSGRGGHEKVLRRRLTFERGRGHDQVELTHRGLIDRAFKNAARRWIAAQRERPVWLPLALDDHADSVIRGRSASIVGESRPDMDRFAANVLFAIDGEGRGAVLAHQLGATQIADRLYPIAGEEYITHAPSPPPGFVRGVIQDLSRTDILETDDGQPLAIGGEPRAMLGEHSCGRFESLRRPEPEERRQFSPDV